MDFLDCIPPLRIDRYPGEEVMWMGPRDLEDMVVADQELRVCRIEAAVPFVDPIHTEDDGLLHMAGGAQLGE